MAGTPVVTDIFKRYGGAYSRGVFFKAAVAQTVHYEKFHLPIEHMGDAGKPAVDPTHRNVEFVRCQHPVEPEEMQPNGNGGIHGPNPGFDIYSECEPVIEGMATVDYVWLVEDTNEPTPRKALAIWIKAPDTNGHYYYVEYGMVHTVPV